MERLDVDRHRALSTFGSQGNGLDAAGDVVGRSGVPGGNVATKVAPFYSQYTASGWATMVNLGNLSSFSSSYLYGGAYAINNGTIVGYATTGVAVNPTTAYAWESSRPPARWSALQTLVPAFASSNFASGRLSVADNIDGTGKIVGVGITNSGAQDAFLLTPTPEPSTIALLLAPAACVLGYAWRRRASRKIVACLAVLAVGLTTAVTQAQVYNVFNMPNGEASLQFVTVGSPNNAQIWR